MLLKNQSFGYSSLARCLRSGDFYVDPYLQEESYRKKVIEEAIRIADSKFSRGISIKEVMASGKKAYAISKLSEKLVLRRCVSNIRSCTSISTVHRNTVAGEAVPFLKEGTPYRVYRLDIKSFFESVDINDVGYALDRNSNLSVHTNKIIMAFLSRFRSEFGEGIPRGVEISPILSEILLEPFDNALKNHGEVFYYARFVDDILVITSSFEDEKEFLKWVRSRLLKGLFLNHKKKSVVTVCKRTKAAGCADGIEVGAFDFLGYEYLVVDTEVSKGQLGAVSRDVRIDLSKSKANKIKKKISESFYNHVKYPNFKLLYDRLVFLSTNRDMKHNDKNRYIPTGIYYSYSVVGRDSKRLEDLDVYLRYSAQSSRSRLGNLVRGSLSNEERRAILKISFVEGFKKRVHKRFSPSRLEEISKVWR